jgi:hypothetical protein
MRSPVVIFALLLVVACRPATKFGEPNQKHL